MYSNLFTIGSISTWRVTERFFTEFFGFLFDNTSWCYLVFASFFPTLLAFILLLIFVEYGLEYFYRLLARIYSYSALSLSQSKNNRAVTFNQGSKQVLVFSYKFELSTLIPMKCRELLERILRDKLQKKTRLTHPQSQTFDSTNSSILTLSIIIPLRGYLAKFLPHHTHISEKVTWYLESNSERTNSFG